MLRRAAVALATFALSYAPLAATADQAAQPVGDEPIEIVADRISYYGDSAVLRAAGRVQVRLSDGARAEGDLLSFDLGLQRVTLVGHVVLHAGGGDIPGAGLAAFLPFRRTYFVPLAPEADRWTFIGGDYANPRKGRVMPGDAFSVAEPGGHPSILAHRVYVDPAAFARFSPATFEVGVLTTPPMPAFVYNFSPNPDFGVNSLSGATFDLPYTFAGSRSSTDAVHFRYDTTRKTFFSFEHHSVTPGGYAVFSLNPATQLDKQYNLLSYGRLGSRAAVALEAQLFTTQPALSAPTASSGFADLQLTQALRESSVRAETSQAYFSLMAPGQGQPNHPTSAGLEWSGYDHGIGRSGLTFRLESGVGTIHDVFGVGGASFPQTIATSFAGMSLSTPVYAGPFKTSLNAVFQERATRLSYPNFIDTETAQLSAARRLSRTTVIVATYQVASARTADLTRTAGTPNASLGLTPQPLSPNGLPLVGQAGVLAVPRATDRSTIVTGSYAPTADFQITLSELHQRFSPVQVPFVAGPSADTLSGDVRVRVTRTLFLDVNRQYFFNWAGQRFSPRFGVQLSAQ